MYLHLSREISIPAGDIVAIINLNGHPGRSVRKHLCLPLVAVDGIPERDWRMSGHHGRTGLCSAGQRGKRWSGVIRSACARQGMYSKMFEFKV